VKGEGEEERSSALEQAVPSENRAAFQLGTRKPQMVRKEKRGESSYARILKVIPRRDLSVLAMRPQAEGKRGGGEREEERGKKELFDCNGRELGLSAHSSYNSYTVGVRRMMKRSQGRRGGEERKKGRKKRGLIFTPEHLHRMVYASASF